MTTPNIEELRKLAEAATPGPWIDEKNLGWKFPQTQIEAPLHDARVAVLRDDHLDVSCTLGKVEREYSNAAYIAAANPAAILALLDTMQSQAERIADLEKEVAFQIKMKEQHSNRLSDERDTLRAQLAAIAATEPVLVVEKEPDYWSGGHFHDGSKPHIKPTKVWRLPIGTPLFTHPMPAQGVAELVDALEMIVSTHQGHCEHHVGVSKHSYNLANIAEEALSKYKGAK